MKPKRHWTLFIPELIIIGLAYIILFTLIVKCITESNK